MTPFSIGSRRLSLFLCCVFCWLSARGGAAEPVSFRGEVAPILQTRCIACHGAKKAEGGFRTDSYSNVMKEGDSGMAGIVAHRLDDSEVYRRIAAEDEDERMPAEAEALSDKEIRVVRRWIEEGAHFDADDPTSELMSIIPPPTHPDPPHIYPHRTPVIAVAFSRDGTELYAGGYHELTVWDVATGSLLRRIQNVAERTYSIAPSPDGRRLAVACGNPGRLGETRIFESANGKLTAVWGTTSDVMFDATFDAAGKRLATASADGVIRVFRVDSGEIIHEISSHSDWVSSIAWNHDGTRLASASRDKTAKVFDANTGELLATYSGHGDTVHSVAFHPNGEEVYSGGVDGRLHLWTIEDVKKKMDVKFGGAIHKLLVRSDFLFAASSDQTVRQFDAHTGKKMRSFDEHQDWAISIAFHTESRRVASGGFDGRVHIWNAEDGKIVSALYAAPGNSTDQ